MADKTWKAVERRLAEQLGGKRVPLSGLNNRFASGDIDHPRLFVEVKTRKAMAWLSWWKKTKEDNKKAHKELNWPQEKKCVLIMQQKGSREYMSMISFEDLVYYDQLDQFINSDPDLKKRFEKSQQTQS